MKQSLGSCASYRTGNHPNISSIMLTLICSLVLALAMAGGAFASPGTQVALADEAPAAEQPAEPADQPAPAEAAPADQADGQNAMPADPGIGASVDELVAQAEATTAGIPTGEAVEFVDTAGNMFVATDSTSTTSSAISTARDLVWFGNDFTTTGATVGGDVIAAGNNLSLSDAQVAGDIRMAGNALALSSTSAGGNITLAGNAINVADDVHGAGVAIAASSARFEGTADALYIAAANVTLNGTVNGDAEVWGGVVTIGDNAHVTGTLRVHAPSEPTIPASASVGSLEFVEDDGLSESTITVGPRINLSWTSNDAFGIVTTVLTLVVCAILLALLFRRGVESCAERMRTHPAALIASGCIAFLIGLPVAVLLMIAFVTLPLGIALMLMSFVVMCICVPFTAAVLGCAILPRMHRVLSALIVGLVLAAVLVLTSMYVPIASAIIGLLCFIFMLGCLVQAVFVGMHGAGSSESMDEQPSPELPTSSYGYTTPVNATVASPASSGSSDAGRSSAGGAAGAAGANGDAATAAADAADSQDSASPSTTNFNNWTDDWTKY